MITYREHRPGDLPRLATLTANAMPRDVVNEERLAENILLDVNFDPAGLVIAEHETDGVVGFLYATHAASGVPSQPEDGYLTIGCVHPDHRRQRIGTELLHRAMAHLRGRGATRVTVGGYPQAYFHPGLDIEAYPITAELFAAHGFTRLYTAAAMHLDLDDYITPDNVRDSIRRRTDEGYAFSVAAWDDVPEVIAFATARLAPDWGHAIRMALLRRGWPSRVLLARDPHGSVVGFATYGAYEGLLERFGPYGVDETRRGTGLGRILLHLTLTRMRAEGAHGAWFLWTGENSPAGNLYRATGFEVTRRFDVLRAELTTPGTTASAASNSNRALL